MPLLDRRGGGGTCSSGNLAVRSRALQAFHFIKEVH